MTGAIPPNKEQGAWLRHLLRRLGGLYRDEWAVFRADYKRYFKWAARFLGIGFVLGWAVFYFRPELAHKGLAYILRSLKDIKLGAPPLILALTLFYHNSRGSLLWAATGLVPFVSLPILDPLANGAALGLIAAVSGRMGQNVPLLFLKGVVPHGIFEIPAVLYATSVGIFVSIRLGKKLWAVLRGAMGKPGDVDGDLRYPVDVPGLEERQTVPGDPIGFEAGPNSGGSPAAGGSPGSHQHATPSFAEIAAQAARSFALVVLPLLLVAAFVEAFITPLLV